MKTYSLLAALFLVGCGTAADHTSAVSNTALSSDTPVCIAQSSGFDKQLAAAAPNNAYDVVMETITPDCGASFHTAGPSHLEETRLVRIGSMTKSFVAVVTLQLVAEGKVDLETRLDAYLPDTNPIFAPVTIRQLLQHTSGLGSYTDNDAFWSAIEASPKKIWTPNELLTFAAAQPTTGAPGAGWAYSNTNYILLGQLVEAVDQKPIAASIRARILGPNDLTEVFFDGEEPVNGTMAPGLDENGNDVTTEFDISWAWAAGAIVASPRDLARFVELLGTGALLTPALQAEMNKSVPIAQEPGLNYGLGVFIADASITGGLGPAIGHGGDIMGYHSWGMYFPDKHATIAGTVDSDKGNGNDILVAGITALLTPTAPAAPSARLRLGKPSLRW